MWLDYICHQFKVLPKYHPVVNVCGVFPTVVIRCEGLFWRVNWQWPKPGSSAKFKISQPSSIPILNLWLPWHYTYPALALPTCALKFRPIKRGVLLKVCCDHLVSPRAQLFSVRTSGLRSIAGNDSHGCSTRVNPDWYSIHDNHAVTHHYTTCAMINIMTPSLFTLVLGHSDVNAAVL